MNKQEAVRYIHQMLEQDHAQEEIARLLADRLRAPQDAVRKFVAQTTADYREAKARQAEQAAPSWLRELRSSASAPAQPTPLAEKSLPPAGETPPTAKLPPWLQENSPADVFQPANRAPSLPQENQAHMSRHLIPAGTERVDVPLQQAKSPSKSKDAAAPDPWKDPALNEFILAGLRRSRKRNDVVMAVCERTNISWDQAARIVAQVAIQAHGQGAARTSESIMFVALLATVGGFLLSAVYSLPLLATLGQLLGMQLHLPFDGEFATRQPMLGIGLSTAGLLLVGVGAALAYLFYHAAEEHEA